ncbi:MAG: MFS transporter, partial [Chlorobium sp.]
MIKTVPSHSLGPIALAPSVLPRHGVAYLYAAFFSIGLVTFVSIGQAYILNENLKIPTSLQGA